MYLKFTEPYPNNLYNAVFGCDFADIYGLPPDAMKTVEYVLSTLSEREKQVIIERVVNHITIKSIAEKMGVGSERIRQIQIRVLRKLRHPSRAKYLKNGIAVQKRLEAQYAEESARCKDTANRPENIEICTLDLSVRSSNCLRRKGINTLADLLRLSRDDLLKIWGLGKKSYDEIIAKCAEMGFGIKDCQDNENERIK